MPVAKVKIFLVSGQLLLESKTRIIIIHGLLGKKKDQMRRNTLVPKATGPSPRDMCIEKARQLGIIIVTIFIVISNSMKLLSRAVVSFF